MGSPKRLARIAGLLYLVVGILGGFAFAGVYSAMYVAGDAAATASNLVANAGLVRIGVAADLIQVVVWVFLSLTLYVLLRHVSAYAARAMVVLVAIGASISFLNILFEFQGMRVATDPTYLAAVGTAGSTALAMLMLDLQHYGYAIAGIFFGLWLVPLGYLAFKSGMFPKVLGIVLVVGGIGYLFDTLATFVAPELTAMIHPVAALLGVVAEISLLAYLLIKGVRSPARWIGRPRQLRSPRQRLRRSRRAGPIPPVAAALAAATVPDLHRHGAHLLRPKESIAMTQSPTMAAQTEFTTSQPTERADPAWIRPWLRAEGLATRGRARGLPVPRASVVGVRPAPDRPRRIDARIRSWSARRGDRLQRGS